MNHPKFIDKLSVIQKAELFDALISDLDEINKNSGRCIGTIQLYEMIEEYAIRDGIIKCPHCGK